jgi:hypothetical protein
VSSLGLVDDNTVILVPFVEVCVTVHWLDCSKWIVERHDQYHHVSSAVASDCFDYLADSVAH